MDLLLLPYINLLAPIYIWTWNRNQNPSVWKIGRHMYCFKNQLTVVYKSHVYFSKGFSECSFNRGPIYVQCKSRGSIYQMTKCFGHLLDTTQCLPLLLQSPLQLCAQAGLVLVSISHSKNFKFPLKFLIPGSTLSKNKRPYKSLCIGHSESFIF